MSTNHRAPTRPAPKWVERLRGKLRAYLNCDCEKKEDLIDQEIGVSKTIDWEQALVERKSSAEWILWGEEWEARNLYPTPQIDPVHIPVHRSRACQSMDPGTPKTWGEIKAAQKKINEELEHIKSVMINRYDSSPNDLETFAKPSETVLPEMKVRYDAFKTVPYKLSHYSTKGSDPQCTIKIHDPQPDLTSGPGIGQIFSSYDFDHDTGKLVELPPGMGVLTPVKDWEIIAYEHLSVERVPLSLMHQVDPFTITYERRQELRAVHKGRYAQVHYPRGSSGCNLYYYDLKYGFCVSLGRGPRAFSILRSDLYYSDGLKEKARAFREWFVRYIDEWKRK